MTTDTLARRASHASPADALSVLAHRRSVGAAFLREPGPGAHALERMLTIAARVPDHGALVPWRFIVVQGEVRSLLAKRLGEACVATAAHDSGAQDQAAKTVEKLARLFGPPLVVIVVARPDDSAKIPVWEQTLSAGAVCMNLMHAATALGFASNWLTGWAATHPAARPVLRLEDGETVVGIIPIGTAMEKPSDRPRPDLSRVVTRWEA